MPAAHVVVVKVLLYNAAQQKKLKHWCFAGAFVCMLKSDFLTD